MSYWRVFVLQVCEEFCNRWYDACKTAILKGTVIKTLYESGKKFCLSRRFKVEPAANGRCFNFDPLNDKNSAARLHIASHTLLSSLATTWGAAAVVLRWWG
jgi:hypothetical protein